MTSEIRVNKINNRAGLGTVEYTPTGIIVSGIVTAYEFDGNFDTTPGIVVTGIATAAGIDLNGDLDVDGHTNLDNVSISGVTTFSGAIGGTFDVDGHTNLDNVNISGMTTTTGNLYLDGGNINIGTGVTIKASGEATYSGIVTASAFKLSDGTAVGGLQQTNTLNFGGAVSIINTGAHDLNLSITDQGSIKFRTETDSGGGDGWDIDPFGNFIPHVNDGNNIGSTSKRVKYIYSDEVFANKFIVQSTIVPNQDSLKDIGSNSVRFRNAYVDNYYGDGSNLSNLPAGAPVGGASTNTVFFENDKAVAVNYQVTSTKNAMSAGPIAINAGIAVTVPSGCAWTIV